MKRNALVLLSLVSFVALGCASSPKPVPEATVTPAEQTVAETTDRAATIGRRLGTVAGVLAWLGNDDPTFETIREMRDSGEAIGAASGAAHAIRITKEFDQQERELAAIEGAEVIRVAGDVIAIRATDAALPAVAANLAQYERDIELFGPDPKSAGHTLALLVANGVAGPRVTVRISPNAEDVFMRVR